MVERKQNVKVERVSSGRRTLRFTMLLSILLGGVLAILLVALAFRMDLTWEFPVSHVQRVSERTRDILADTQGSFRITCFMDRRHPMFRPVSRLLRGFQQASRDVAGANLQIEYVDPRWDLLRSGRMASANVPENALVFERQHRRTVVTLDDMLFSGSRLRERERKSGERSEKDSGLGVFRGEAACAAAIARLALPFEHAAVYWMQGHGEVSFQDYDELHGFSDIARELMREGFDVRPLLLPGRREIPPDCHLLVIAGARHDFAKEEQKMLNAFLQGGGRLLCLLEPSAETGLSGIFEKWGIRVMPYIGVSPKTLTGRDVVASSFGDHVVSRDLANASVIFGAPACLEKVDSAMDGADRPKVTLLVSTDETGWGESAPDSLPRVFDPLTDLKGPVSFAAVSEQGGDVAKDVTFKPTRLCVVGETDFVMNGVLAARANANRDFFINAVSWLVGIDTGTASSLGGDATLVTGLSRRGWMGLMAVSAIGVPCLVLLLFAVGALRRNL